MSRQKALILSAAILFLASIAPAATITGVVRGPDGAPFRGAKVKAQNSRTRMSVIVFSDSDGHYKVPELPAGDYEVQATAIGFASDPKSGVFLNASQDQNLDWNMQKQMVKWQDIPIYQGIQLMPDGKGKARFVQTCGASCHGFRSMIGDSSRSEGLAGSDRGSAHAHRRRRDQPDQRRSGRIRFGRLAGHNFWDWSWRGNGISRGYAGLQGSGAAFHR